MEKTYSNVWDSAHGLFGIMEDQYCTNKKTAIKFLKKIQNDYNILQIWEETNFQYEDTYMDSLKYCLFDKNHNLPNNSYQQPKKEYLPLYSIQGCYTPFQREHNIL